MWGLHLRVEFKLSACPPLVLIGGVITKKFNSYQIYGLAKRRETEPLIINTASLQQKIFTNYTLFHLL